jgi:UDP-N-acetylmuramate--alanine ligase
VSWAGRRLHFVGIGGAGMSGLALVAAELGAQVTGSDRAESPYLPALRADGIAPAIGPHTAVNVPPDAEVVYSSAVARDNPERTAAGGRELHRAELLAELTRLKRTIAVSGTHGKTTVTSMVAHVLTGCGLHPGYLIGGELRATGRNAAWGSGEWLVVEADESDRSLLALDAEIAVLTNAELDHHATYGSQAELEATFRTFLAAARARVVWDRPALRALAGPEAVTFDVPAPELSPGGVAFRWRGHDVRLVVPGAHNAINAAGALEACRLAGADPAAAARALAGFTGAVRRFERLGATASGAEVYDDYAHHPTEVAATLAAARTLQPRRVLAAFQPHLYSRTAALHREFGTALAAADVAAVLDVYPARERAADWPGVDGALVARAVADAAAGREVAWVPGHADAERFLRARLRDGDLLVVMGAGDVDAVGRALVRGPPGESAAPR